MPIIALFRRFVKLNYSKALKINLRLTLKNYEKCVRNRLSRYVESNHYYDIINNFVL
nr:MAG TPA: hypothetical protein [Caudoviricetes sp.]